MSSTWDWREFRTMRGQDVSYVISSTSDRSLTSSIFGPNNDYFLWSHLHPFTSLKACLHNSQHDCIVPKVWGYFPGSSPGDAIFLTRYKTLPGCHTVCTLNANTYRCPYRADRLKKRCGGINHFDPLNRWPIKSSIRQGPTSLAAATGPVLWIYGIAEVCPVHSHRFICFSCFCLFRPVSISWSRDIIVLPWWYIASVCTWIALDLFGPEQTILPRAQPLQSKQKSFTGHRSTKTQRKGVPW